MEKFRALIKESGKAFDTADHLTYMTYPVVTEIKLMLLILNNIYTALTKGMDALLYYDWIYKRIPRFPDNFKEKFEIFKTKTINRFHIPRETALLIYEINQILEHRKAAPMEFTRDDRIIMASNNYKLKTLDIKQIKKYLQETKLFINQLNEINKENDRKFERT